MTARQSMFHVLQQYHYKKNLAHLADGGEKIDCKTTESAVASTVVTAEEHLLIIIANNNEHNVDICMVNSS